MVGLTDFIATCYYRVISYDSTHRAVVFLLRSVKRTIPGALPCVEVAAIGFVSPSSAFGSAAASRGSSPSRRSAADAARVVNGYFIYSN
jgi:hypothetical protein